MDQNPIMLGTVQTQNKKTISSPKELKIYKTKDMSYTNGNNKETMGQYWSEL